MRNHLVLLDPLWFEEDCNSLLPLLISAILLSSAPFTYCHILPTQKVGQEGQDKITLKINS